MRAVFDTNIVVSALIFGGRLAWLRAAWAEGRLVPVICRQTAAELLRVLAYPKFRLSGADRHDLLEDFLPYAEIFVLAVPAPDPQAVCRDLDDTVFLRLALEAAAPLVTGDADLLALKHAVAAEILTPAELRASLGSSMS